MEHKLQLVFLLAAMLVVLFMLLFAAQYLGNLPGFFGGFGWRELVSVGWVTVPL